MLNNENKKYSNLVVFIKAIFGIKSVLSMASNRFSYQKA